MRFQKILCPVDFSECSREAFARAVDLASENDAELNLVNVNQAPDTCGEIYAAEFSPELKRYAQNELETWLDEARKRGAKRVKGAVVLGIPWNEIVERAHNLGADLVVMGTRGRTGLKHLLMGSVAERVVQHAKCTVMVVRPTPTPKLAQAAA